MTICEILYQLGIGVYKITLSLYKSAINSQKTCGLLHYRLVAGKRMVKIIAVSENL